MENSSIITELLSDYHHLLTQRIKQYGFFVEEIIKKFQSLLEKEEKDNKETSNRFNVLHFFGISETVHSQLLGFFLDPHASHGQGDLFLKEFVNSLNINYDGGSKWFVTVETERIDILIRRNYPHSAIIIENKSNNASDQENQIYRYWHRAIYSKNKDWASSDTYRIIYLTSNHWKKPNENTLLRPDGWGLKYPNLPERVPLKQLEWQFNNQIREWLEKCAELLPENNNRLKEYIKQYNEYWSKK